MKTLPLFFFAGTVSFYASTVTNYNILTSEDVIESSPADTITWLDQLKANKKAVFKAPNGKYYHVASEQVGDDFEEVAPSTAGKKKFEYRYRPPNASKKPW